MNYPEEVFKMIVNKDIRIVYMGTPEFAVEPLRTILNLGYTIVCVVTAPDKPAGRGQKLAQSAVKAFALEHNLPILQPANLKDEHFRSELLAYKPDIAVVVAFRMLPESVWRIPKLGTFNLHASLLPQYRGAAPINWAIINGETVTGLTTFLIDERIDTGSIILQEEVGIAPNQTAGELHDALMVRGGALVARTIEHLVEGGATPINQSELEKDFIALKGAPKLYRESCKIDWAKPRQEIHNRIRGLSPYPGAWCDVTTPDGQKVTAKILGSRIDSSITNIPVPGHTLILGKKAILVGCLDGNIEITQIQLAGRKPLTADEFLRGLQGEARLDFT